MKFYKFSCAVMAIASFIMVIVTAIYASSGENLYQTWLTPVLLIVFALITVVCLCISTVKGNFIYKAGFYVLHIGLVVAIIGFIVYGLYGAKYRIQVLCDGRYYNSINDLSEKSEGEIIPLDFYYRLDDTYTEYYPVENESGESSNDSTVAQPKNPKHYIAYLTIMEELGNPQTVELTVNNPIHVKGYKIYLMGMISDVGMEGATLIFKYNPAEYTILTGIILIIVGTFVMCLFSDIGFKLKRINSKAKEVEQKKGGGEEK